MRSTQTNWFFLPFVVVLVAEYSGFNSLAASGDARAYTIRRGDTLGRIAQRHFGKASRWREILALNSKVLGETRPLRVGTKITLPSNQRVRDTVELSMAAPQRRSQEWKKLPRQNWERVQTQLPPQYDPQGFDQSNRVKFRSRPTHELVAWLSDQELEPLGEIQTALVEGRYFHLRDRMVVKPREGQVLAVGQDYTVTSEPEVVKSPDGRKTYEYVNLGTIRLLSVTETQVTAELVKGAGLIPRGSWIIARFPNSVEPEYRASRGSVQGSLMISRNTGGAYATAQHKYVYIDRGTQDGVQVGNVFRAYGEKDPDTEDEMERTEYVRLGHFHVLMTTERYSLAVVINSRTAIDDETKVYLVQDVNDLSLEPLVVLPPAAPAPEIEIPPATTDLPPAPPVEPPPAVPTEEDLDKLDDGKDLTEEERKNLEQLEATPTVPSETAPPDLPPADVPPPDLPPSEMIPPTDAAPVPEVPTEIEPPPL